LAPLFTDLGCLLQDVPLEDVIGRVGADQKGRVNNHRYRRQFRLRHPRRGEGQQGDEEEVDEVNPHQSQRRAADQASQV
jgi:hypothetical protein